MAPITSAIDPTVLAERQIKLSALMRKYHYPNYTEIASEENFIEFLAGFNAVTFFPNESKICFYETGNEDNSETPSGSTQVANFRLEYYGSFGGFGINPSLNLISFTGKTKVTIDNKFLAPEILNRAIEAANNRRTYL